MLTRSRSIRWAAPFLALACGLAGLPALGADPVKPDYEVKCYLLAAAALNEEYAPRHGVREVFGLKDDKMIRMRMAFLDGEDLPLHTAGWDVRFRRKEEAKLEVTYKRRYRVANGDLEGALKLAARDGFDAGEGDYKAQVEWGYCSQTLTFSNEKEVEADRLGELELPLQADARGIAVKRLPGKLEHLMGEGKVRTLLESARLYGPVKGRRWKGEWEGVKVDFEVWEVPGNSGDGCENLVEVSFKEKDPREAKNKRAKLLELLDTKGWLLKEDALKTERILKGK
jgi:hypothetical protein